MLKQLFCKRISCSPVGDGRVVSPAVHSVVALRQTPPSATCVSPSSPLRSGDASPSTAPLTVNRAWGEKQIIHCLRRCYFVRLCRGGDNNREAEWIKKEKWEERRLHFLPPWCSWQKTAQLRSCLVLGICPLCSPPRRWRRRTAAEQRCSLTAACRGR